MPRMIRCDFCGRPATDVIRIGRTWAASCCGCADHTPHSDRLGPRGLRRPGLTR